jgi:hypothetical protein
MALAAFGPDSSIRRLSGEVVEKEFLLNAVISLRRASSSASPDLTRCGDNAANTTIATNTKRTTLSLKNLSSREDSLADTRRTPSRFRFMV